MPTPDERKTMIDKIRRLPAQLDNVVSSLSDLDLTTPFRAGEWTVAQNVHHLVDAHMNAYIRMKLVLLEDNPILKPYDQNAWAETPDSTHPHVKWAIRILEGLHDKWAIMLDSVSNDEWARTGNHLESGSLTLDDLLVYYSGHGEAHLEQIAKTLSAR